MKPRNITFMLFLDCTGRCKAHGKTIGQLEKAGWNVGVAWQDGRMFHGPCTIRMNLALPLSRVQEAFALLDKYISNGERRVGVNFIFPVKTAKSRPGWGGLFCLPETKKDRNHTALCNAVPA